MMEDVKKDDEVTGMNAKMTALTFFFDPVCLCVAPALPGTFCSRFPNLYSIVLIDFQFSFVVHENRSCAHRTHDFCKVRIPRALNK